MVHKMIHSECGGFALLQSGEIIVEMVKLREER